MRPFYSQFLTIDSFTIHPSTHPPSTHPPIHPSTIHPSPIMAPTKVLIVEDSPVAMEVLQRLFKSTPEIEIVGVARNGQEALAMIPRLNPTVICTDFHMEPIDGLELTKQVMANFPRPILVLSNSVKSDDTKNVFALLQAGASDIYPKPMGGDYAEYEAVKQKILSKIKLLAGMTVKARPIK
ncbi:response regulator [Chamaesiphon sp.]|uniref:response regulator n=1 Tax=Chamaesiphon sp. TaxID=2814140 RepID=UPI003593BEE0